jgi:transposase
MAHGLNANLVHKWRRQAHPSVLPSTQAFVPVALAAAVSQPQRIELELQRGALSVKVNWPLASASACAAWLREILR